MHNNLWTPLLESDRKCTFQCQNEEVKEVLNPNFCLGVPIEFQVLDSYDFRDCGMFRDG